MGLARGHCQGGLPHSTLSSKHPHLSTTYPHPPQYQAYTSKGVKQLFPWQAAALACATAPPHRHIVPLCPGGTACDDNLIYTAPTSGGKSLVAEILLARALVSTCTLLPPRKGNKLPRRMVGCGGGGDFVVAVWWYGCGMGVV